MNEYFSSLNSVDFRESQSFWKCRFRDSRGQPRSFRRSRRPTSPSMYFRDNSLSAPCLHLATRCWENQVAATRKDQLPVLQKLHCRLEFVVLINRNCNRLRKFKWNKSSQIKIIKQITVIIFFGVLTSVTGFIHYGTKELSTANITGENLKSAFFRWACIW